ncbi:MAG: AAA family ATPase, partial [Campylobacterales bacterium]
MKKLPLGIQTFERIINDDYLYIDKTKEIYSLIGDGNVFYFLSRPRRFGKSLFIDTLHSLFEAKKELFEGLYIYDKWDWDTSYPVIKISWGGSDYQTFKNLQIKAKKIFNANQDRLGVKCDEFDIENLSICFEELIQKTYEKYNQQVVVLIDEYDKPILNVIENLPQAKQNREFIKGLYEVLKENERYIKFGFLTGVSKFSKASIFSGLNMLRDISLNPNYGNICGYTQNDIETTILPY